MIKIITRRGIILNFIWCLIFVTFFPVLGHAESPKRVLIMPMTIHSDSDLSFLQQGIREMLASRLSQSGKMVAVFPPEGTDAQSGSTAISSEEALRMATELQTDYVITGSLTVFGESISTDARFLDVQSKAPVVAFSETGTNHGDIIQHINNFATRINEEVFGVTAAATAPRKPVEQKPRDDIHQHPETLLDEYTPSEALTPGIQLETPTTDISRWIGPSYKLEIKGMSIGDVDGDNKNEVVFVNHNQIHVYRIDGRRLTKIAEIEEKRHYEFLSVDVADINKNGSAEIFITNLPNNSEILQSFVLEYDGSDFKTILKDQKWYYRTLTDPDQGKILMGQVRGRTRDTFGLNNLFTGNIFELRWEGGGYAPMGKVTAPPKANVYNFSIGDFLNTGSTMSASYSDAYRLRVHTANGGVEWTSDDPYGSTNTYMEIQGEIDVESKDRYFLPTRILASDLDGDGKTEVLVVNNKEDLRSAVRLKLFKNGQVECLSWNGLSMAPKWRTESASKYISDFAVADIDHDGEKELVYAVVAATESTFNKGKSFLVFQELPKPKPATPESQISN